MRFLHTADWQIGMKARSLGATGKRVREERLNACRRVVEVAQQEGVQFLLLAGDIFEDNAVDRVLVQTVADILRNSGKPVYVIPGNHDPCVPGSVWEHPAWKSASNVRVLTESTPLELPGGMLFPCPLHEKHSSRNPVAQIPAGRSGGIRIGVAHGTVEGVNADEPDYPIPRDAAQQAGLDYLALGHWHSYAAYWDADGACRMAYSGTHETTKFGERDSGNVLIVEIAAEGVTPGVRSVRTGGLAWIQMEKEVRECGDLAALRKEIDELREPEQTLVDVAVSGVLSAGERAELEHIENILSSPRFLWGRLAASALRPSPQDDSWINTLPSGIIQAAALRLRENREAAPEVAARALMELYALAREVTK